VAELVARSIGAAQSDLALDEPTRERLSDEYGRRAMAWLYRARQHGLKDAAPLESDPDFQPLRSRADYQELLAQLKSAAAPR
jgi:hypothetical protein